MPLPHRTRKALSRASLMVAAALLGMGASPQAKAANLYWDSDASAAGNSTTLGTNLGGSGTWGTSTANWYNGSAEVVWNNANLDTAVLWGADASLKTLTLGTGITVGGLTFNSPNYLITSGTLTLGGTTPTLTSTLYGGSATIASIVAGTAGFTKSGGGVLLLTNSANSFTGTTTVANGTLLVTSDGALGALANSVTVAGNAGTIGTAGGTLVLAPGAQSSLTTARSFSFYGKGYTDRSGSIVGNGNAITLSGTVTTQAGAIDSGFVQIGGLMDFTGTLAVGATSGNYLYFGSTNQKGAGSYQVSGIVTGSGAMYKANGTSTLIFNPTDASGFSGLFRTNAGSIRFLDPTKLGTNTGTGASGTLYLSAASTMEFRSGTTTGGTVSWGKAVYVGNNYTSTLFADHALGSSAINQVNAFASFYGAGTNATSLNLTGRNGAGFSFTGFTSSNTATAGSSMTLTSSLGTGTTTIAGDVASWDNTNTVARTITVAVSGGDVILTGSIAAAQGTGSINHLLTKSGIGTLTIQGVTSTLTGDVTLSSGGDAGVTTGTSGTTYITDFRSLGTSSAAVINLGNAGTTTGSLTIGVAGTTPTIGGLTTSRVISINTSTKSPTINASQPGANPVIINSNFTGVANTTARTLFLGGSNTADNILNGILPDLPNVTGGVISLTKNDVGTWALSGANTYTGGTTITGGTLKLKATAAASNIIASTAAVTFGNNALTYSAGGTLELVALLNTATTETLGALTPTAGMGTVKLTSNGTGIANLTFTALGTVVKASSVNIDASAGSVTLTSVATTAATTSVGNGKVYYNGTNFAISTSGVLSAMSYGTVGFTSAAAGAATMATATHNLIAGTITAQTNVTATSLKLTSFNLTLASGQTLTVNAGAVANDGGILQTGGTATISGGTGITTGGAGALIFRVNGSTDVLNLNTPMLVTTTGGFTKSGLGALVLNATNVETGAGVINILEGTVQMGSAGVIGAGAGNGGTGALNLLVRGGATLDLNGTTQTVAVMDGNGTITNTSATAATLVATNGTVWSGSFTEGVGAGKLNVTRNVVNSFTVNGLSTNTGVMTFNVTTAKFVTVTTLADIGVASSIGKGDATDTASNAASLVFSGDNTSGLAYAGLASVSTNRLFTLNSAIATPGVTIANNSSYNAALVFSNTNAIVFGTAANGYATAQTLALGGTSLADNYFGPKLTNNASATGVAQNTVLAKNGASIWVLGNTLNDYSGQTAISAGVLNTYVSAGSTLSANSPLFINGGQLQTQGNFTRSLAASAVAGTPSVTLGATASGFSAGYDKLTVAIGGTLAPTALTWGSGGFFTDGTIAGLVLNSATSLAEVEFRNAIDLNQATNDVTRTITVTDNAATGTDFATITGVISNTQAPLNGVALSISGNILRLFGANTYSGSTKVTGTLTVNTLGISTTSGVGTSVGTSTGANTATGAIRLGNASTTGGVLQYVGLGETSDRLIQFDATTGAPEIHADGSGPLVLSNVQNNIAAGAKTLYLRGTNTGLNMITSMLTDNTGSLGLNIDGSATWVLTGANTFTGAVAVNSVAGIGNNTAFGDASVTNILKFISATIFAYGADRTVGNPIDSNTTSTSYSTVFQGDYSLTFTGGWTFGNTSASNTYINNIASGKTLSFTGSTGTFNAMTSNRTVTFNGSGDTVWSVPTSTTTLFGTNITYSGTGSLTIGALQDAFKATVTPPSLTVSSGTVRIGANNVLPTGATYGNTVMSPAVSVTATFNLNGYAQNFNGFTATTAGSSIFEANSSTARTVTFGLNDQAVNVGSITASTPVFASFAFRNSAAGTLSLTKAGTGTMTVYNGATLEHNGLTTVSAGTLTLAGPLTADSFRYAPNFVVSGGASLNLFNASGRALTVSGLDLGAGSGTATLGMELGSVANSDKFVLSGAATLANTVNFQLRTLGGFTAGTYDLITATSGLGAGTKTFSVSVNSQAGQGSTYSLASTTTAVTLTVADLAAGDIYWKGGVNNNWFGYNASGSNFTSDLAGTTVIQGLPGTSNKVIFNSTGVAGPSQAVSVDGPVFSGGLVFNNAAGSPAITSISLKTAASATTGIYGTLTLAPSVSSAGIDVQAGAPASIAITSSVFLGANQTWKVTDAGTTLTAYGFVQGNFGFTKQGAGTLVLGGVIATSTTSGTNGGATTLILADATGILPGMSVMSTAGGITGGDLVIAVSGNTITLNNSRTTTTGATVTFGYRYGGMYTGATTIEAGTVKAGFTSNTSPFSPMEIQSGATFSTNGFSTQYIAALSGAGTLNNNSATTDTTVYPGLNSANTTFSGLLANGSTNTLGVSKSGSGVLTLAPTSVANTATGTITVTGGSILLDHSASSLTSIWTGRSGTTGTVTLNGGGLTWKAKLGTTMATVIGNLTSSAGANFLTVDLNGAAATQTVTVGTLTASAAGASLLVTQPTGAAIKFNTSFSGLTGASQGKLVFTTGDGNFDFLINTGANTTSAAFTAYTLNPTPAAGATDTNTPKLTSSLSLSGSYTTDKIKIQPSGASQSLTIGAGNTLSLTSGGFIFQSNDAYTITGGSIRGMTSSNSDLVAHVYGSGVLTLASNVTNGVGLSVFTKAGSGTLTLTGQIQSTGAIYINQGVLNINAAQSIVGNLTVLGGTLNVNAAVVGNTSSTKLDMAASGSGGKSVTNVSADMTLLATSQGSIAGSANAYNQTAGTVTVTPGIIASGTVNQWVAGNYGYGYFNLTGGIYNISGSGNRFAASTTGFGVAVVNVGGTGFLDHTNGEYFLNYGNASFNITDTGLIDHTGSTSVFGLLLNSSVPDVLTSLNVAGGTVKTGDQPIRLGNATTAGSNPGSQLFINVAKGTLSTGANLSTSLPTTGDAFIYFTGAGGTLKASNNLTSFLPATIQGATINAVLYAAIDNQTGTNARGTTSGFRSAAPNFLGGLTVDTSGFDVAFHAPLRAAAGVGITQADMTLTAGSGYVGAPLVRFSTTGMIPGGTPAQGYAIIDANLATVIGIVITNPGTYVSGTIPKLDLIGGGGSGASVAFTGLSTANAAAVLTKVGNGKLTLGADNTYTGGTNVNAGTLALGGNEVLANTGAVTLGGGTLDLVTFAETVGIVTLDSGTITGTTGSLSSSSNFLLRSGTVSGILAGTGGIAKTTSGVVALSVANTFSGPVSVTAGKLQFSTDANLGNASATNLVSVNGGTLAFTPGSSLTLSANHAVEFGTTGATIEVEDAAGVLTLPSVSATSTGNLTKTGVGKLVLTGSTAWNSGANGVTVNAGTLQASFGTGGISTLNVGAAGTLSFLNSSAVVLTLGASPGALTLAGGARLAFELGASGTNDKIVVGAGGTAVTAGTVTINLLTIAGFGSGTFELLSAPSGLNPLGVVYSLGDAPTGYNYTINQTDTLVSLAVVAFVPRYWTNSQTGGSWATLTGGTASNWSTDTTGLTNYGATPGSADTVIFSATSLAGGALAATLDGSYTIDGMQFINATSTATTTFSLAQGTSGTLTIAPSSTSSGIVVAANAGAVTISAPLVASTSGGAASQTWSIDGTGASSLTVTGNVTISAGINKTGAGTLTLSGTNTGSGGVTIGAGALTLGSADALGTSVLTVGALTTFDNSSGSALTLANNAANWNGAFTFTGTNDLSFGTGAATLGQSLTATVTTASRVLTVGSLTDGAGSYGLTKAGTGTLTISGAVTIDGTLALTAGALNIGTGGTMGAVTAASGTTLTMSGTNALTSLIGTSATLTLSGANTISGALTLNGGTLTASGNNPSIGGVVTVNSGTATFSGDNGFASASLVAGTLTLSGTNTFGTGLSMTAGTLNLNSVGALGGGTLAISGGTLNNSSGSAKVLTSAGAGSVTSSFTFTGGSSLSIGTSSLAISGNPTFTVSANTLTFGGNASGSSSLIKAGIGNLAFGGGLTLTGSVTVSAGTLTTGGNSSLGTTTINGSAILVLAGNNTLDGLLMTTATTTGPRLDLSNGSASSNLLTYSANSSTVGNIVIGSAQEMVVSGPVTVGVNGSGATTTRFTISGAGTFSIGASGVPTNAGFQLGNHSTDAFSNDATLTMSGLTTFYANLGIGIFKVGDPTNSSGAATVGSKLYLAKTSTIIAADITLDTPNGGVTNFVYLGDTANVFNANNLYLSGNGNRANGQISWDTGVTTGTFRLRGLDGLEATPVTNLTVASGASTTAVATTGLLNLAGHDSNILATTIGIGGNSGASATPGHRTGTLTFDTGTLVATTVNLGTRTGAFQFGNTNTGTLNLMASGGSGSATFTTLTMGQNTSTGSGTNGAAIATLNIGGGTVIVSGIMTMGSNTITNTGVVAQTVAPVQATTNISGGTVTIGTLNMNTNSSANTGLGNASLSTLSITGGTVGITSLRLAATSNAAATATSTLSITGGTLNLGANLDYTASSGTVNSTLTLNGGTLNLGGFAIGSSLLPVGSGTGALNLQSGTLKAVSQINGGSGFTKTTSNTLIIDGTNSFSGVFTISSGTVQVGAGSTTGTLGTVSVTNNATLKFNRSNSATFSNAISGSGSLIQDGVGGTTILTGANSYSTTTITNGTLQIGSGTTGTLGSGAVTNNATLSFGRTDSSTVANAISGSGTLVQDGVGGTTILTATNSYGTTTITNGTLQVGSGTTGTLGSGAVTNNATLSFGRTNSSTVANAISGSGILVQDGVGGTTILTGSNSYGTTTITNGTLQVGNGTTGSLGSGAVTNNATLSFGRTNSSTVANAISGSGILVQDGVGGTTILTGTNSYGTTTITNGTLQVGNGTTGSLGSGAVTNNATLKFGRTDSHTVSNDISGSGTLAQDGVGGTTILTGTNSYGATTITNGTLQIGNGSTTGTLGSGAVSNAGTLVINRSNAYGVNNAISGVGGLTQSGNGVLTLSGNNSFSGGTTISAGTVRAGHDNAFGNLAADALALNAGALTSDGSTARAFANNVTVGGNITLGATTTNTGDLTFNGTVGLGSAVRTLTVNSAVTFAGIVSDGGLTKAGNGVLTLSGNNSFTGGTTISAGTVRAGHDNAFGNLAAHTLALNAGTFTSDGGTARTFANNVTVGGNITLGATTTNTGDLTFNGTVGLGSAVRTLTVNSAVTFAGIVSDGGLTKAGAGTLTLSGNNVFTLGTTISAGTLILNHVSALGTGAVTINGGTLDLNYSTIGAVTNVITTNGGTITGGQTTASVSTAGATPTVTSVLTGGGGLTKTDAGTLTITTANFHTGATVANVTGAVIKAAFLSDTSSSLGASALDVPANLVLGSGAKLEFTGGTATSTSRSFTVGGTAGIVAGTGAGTLEFTSASKLATTGTDPELTLTANNAGSNRFDGIMASGNPLAVLAIDGTGTWVIGGGANGANRFRGDIRVEAGAGATLGFESGSLGMGAGYSTSVIRISDNAVLVWSGANTDDISSRLQIPTGYTAKMNLGNNDVEFAAAPKDANGATITNSTIQKSGTGTGTLKIATTVSSPGLNFDLPLNSGKLTVDGTVGNIALASGTILGGGGHVGTVTAASGSTISPGNSPGNLYGSSLVLFGSSTLEWQVKNASGAVGTGYDTFTVSGALDLSNASSNNRINLRISSLDGNGNGTDLGNPLNFDPPLGGTPIRTFTFATVGSLNLGSNANINDVFTITVGDFHYTGGNSSNAGLWSLSYADNIVTLTAVPEPSTYGFGLGALALAAAAIRRRKRQATKA